MRFSGLFAIYFAGVISGIYLQQNYRGIPDVASVYRDLSDKFRRIEQEHRLHKN